MPEPICWSTLLPAVQAGQEAAAAELYRVFCAAARPYVVRSVGVDYADDVLHEVYINALLAVRRGTIRNPQTMSGFLRKLAHNQVSDEFRRRKRKPEGANPDNVVLIDRSNPEKLAIVQEQIDAALGHMHPIERAVWLSAGETDKKIAERLGIRVKRVRLDRWRGKSRAVRKMAA
jgi:RNA polymerase sigma factor (sigma-70 family)